MLSPPFRHLYCDPFGFVGAPLLLFFPPAGQSLLLHLRQHPSSRLRFDEAQGVVLYGDRLLISEETGFRSFYFQSFMILLRGSFRFRRHICPPYFFLLLAWMKAHVKAFVRNCLTFQHNKYSTERPIGLLQPLPVPHQVWEDLSMDFITHLPPSRARTVIWVVVDRLTKYAHFIGLTSFSASSLAATFAVEIYRLHGMPKSIVSDRDPLFLSRFWRELFRLSGTKLAYSSAYHPQSDGQTEVLNRVLETYLRCFVSDEPRLWFQFLHLAEFWYNSNHHSAIGMSPFQPLYGRPPPSVSSYISGTTPVATLDDALSKRQSILSMACYHLAWARLRMKQQADLHRRDLSFSVGDWVLVRLQPYRQMSVRRRSSQKLASRFFGPFRILRRLGPVAYELDLPPASCIHPVFHASLLKPFHGDPSAASIITPPAASDPLSAFIPSRVLGHRHIHTADGPQSQILVQWADQSETDATWFPVTDFVVAYPDFHLEGKVVLGAPGIDTAQTQDGPTTHEKENRLLLKGPTTSGLPKGMSQLTQCVENLEEFLLDPLS
ncbi:UNVERIFIED_CONTAM: Transposon Ty3-G Gag-Pol polyprotein [Sesamum radiatum]|uniref:Transposon Ty3-G Gag-Pol polyprotein n=1 Tax=Sesamum radiatum TaxID=300843 RepID=A0AAW2VPS9_SESRA